MADGINVSGLVQVMVQFRDAQGDWTGALQKLGESLDMVDIEERVFTHNVPGDRYGGPQGPPIEQQFLGEVHIVRIELSRYDPTVLNLIKQRGVRATLGAHVNTEVGALLLEPRSFRLLLNSPVTPMNYPCAVANSSVQYGKGTKFSSVSLQVECHVDPTTNVLYDSTITAYTTTPPPEE